MLNTIGVRMNTLGEKDIIKMIQVEYNRRIKKIEKLDDIKKELQGYLKKKNEKKKTPKDKKVRSQDVIPPKLTLKNKNTGIKWDVLSVHDDSVLIISPEGEKLEVSIKKINDEFVID